MGSSSGSLTGGLASPLPAIGASNPSGAAGAAHTIRSQDIQRRRASDGPTSHPHKATLHDSADHTDAKKPLSKEGVQNAQLQTENKKVAKMNTELQTTINKQKLEIEQLKRDLDVLRKAATASASASAT